MEEPVVLLPNFTAEQYLTTSDPYRWLEQFKDDKFALQQQCQRMKLQAGSVGVRCFMTLWNTYLESQHKKQGERLDNATQFDAQPVELFSGQYICDDYGVRMSDRFGYEITVCVHPIMPVRRLINIDEGDERLEIAYKKGRSWRSIIIEKSVVASSNQILQLAAYGVVVTSENAKLLSTYLMTIEQLNYDNISEEHSVGRLGWVLDHGFSPYVDKLIFDGEANFRHMFNSVRASGDREKWIDAMKKVRAEKSIGRIFLAASFASALIEPCGLLPFFVHAYGGQGTGKTVSLMIAASVWASPRLGDYLMSFNSTDVGQEMVAAFLNSMPMCMDELQIQASSGIKDYDRILYKLTEGQGKVRGTKTGGVRRVVTWRNCILTTGEYPIVNANSMSGASVRAIEVECVDKIYSDLVGLCAVINENYGYAGREFVEYIRDPDNMAEINNLRLDIYHDLQAAGGEDKQAASLSAILVADLIASTLFFRDGNQLTVDEIMQLMTRKGEIDANVRALSWITEMLAVNVNHFQPNDFGEYKAEVWGKWDVKNVYIIKSVFDREMQNAGFNSKSFLSWAKRKGLILTDSDKSRSTKKSLISGALVNTVCLNKDLVREMTQ